MFFSSFTPLENTVGEFDLGITQTLHTLNSTRMCLCRELDGGSGSLCWAKHTRSCAPNPNCTLFSAAIRQSPAQSIRPHFHLLLLSLFCRRHPASCPAAAVRSLPPLPPSLTVTVSKWALCCPCFTGTATESAIRAVPGEVRGPGTTL